MSAFTMPLALGIGLNKASDHSGFKAPVLRIIRTIPNIREVKCEAKALYTAVGMPSNPGEDEGFKASNAAATKAMDSSFIRREAITTISLFVKNRLR